MKLAAAALLALVSGCSPNAYDLVVRFEPLSAGATAARIEVALVPSCAALGSPTADPVGAVRTIELRPGALDATLGEVPPGSYGLAGRAFDASCNIVAAGCDDVTLVADGEGTLEVVLTAARDGGCRPEETCIDARCVGRTDGGPTGMDGGPGMDAPGVDSGPSDDGGVPGVDGGPPGRDGSRPRRDGGTDGGPTGIDGGGGSCDMRFGIVTSYILCAERPGECEFFVDPPGASATCNAVCMAFGETCLTAYNEVAGCEIDMPIACDSGHNDMICVCTR